jgi:hypothetical protein
MHVKLHYVKEQIGDGDILTTVVCIRLVNNMADIHTKPLGQVDFQRLQHSLWFTRLEW